MDELKLTETYISVDVETSGPYPGEYSLLSIGACTLAVPRETFYVELKPVNRNQTPEALSVHHLSMDRLAVHGLEPAQAVARFKDWLAPLAPRGQQPIFVAFNAPFDWMFVNYYFHRYLGDNPFGHAALDIKAYYMGFSGVTWAETAMRYIGKRYSVKHPLTHNALHDAIDQADIFYNILVEARRLNHP